jgi:hypothetical protein
MAQEHSRNEKAGLDSRIERTAAASVSAVTTNIDWALSQLNVSDAFGRMREQSVDMSYEHSPDEKANFDPGSEETEIVAVSAAHTDYHSALLQIIESAANDPRRLRRLVYELARTNLNEEIRRRSSILSLDDVRESVLALQTAIARVEVGMSRSEPPDIRIPRVDTRLQRSDDGLAHEEAADVGPRRIASHPRGPVGAAPVVHAR